MFPHSIKDLEEEINTKLLEDFSGERTGFCCVGEKKWVLPKAYEKHAEGFYNFELRPDDVWLVTFPRSGTTLCQEIVWLISNNFDYEGSAKASLDERFPFFEFSILHHIKFHEDLLELNNHDPVVKKQLENWRTPGYIFGNKMKSPRFFKTHLPFSLLPQGIEDKCKVIYVARNPKDVAASYYHHNKLLNVHGYKGDLETYLDYFKRDLLVYSPYSEHIKEGWERKDNPNVLFLFYENLVKSPSQEIQLIAEFLNKPINEEQVKALEDHIHIDNFRKAVKVHDEIQIKGAVNNSAEGFIRKGKVGENKEFSRNSSMKEWAYEVMRGLDITFPC